MAEGLNPLLPWALTASALALVALALNLELGGQWGAFMARRDPTVGTLSALPSRRAAGPGVLVLANSRIGFTLEGARLLEELADLGGLEDADGRLVFGPELRASALSEESWRIVAYHPTVVLMQIDLLLPLGEKREAPDPVRRLREYERDGPDRRSGVELLARLWWARRVVVEVPLARSVHEALGEDWWRERGRTHDALRAAGIEVWADPEPWPDALYTDGAHFTAEGGAALRRWLGARLAGA